MWHLHRVIGKMQKFTNGAAMVGFKELHYALLSHVALSPLVRPFDGMNLRIRVHVVNSLNVANEYFTPRCVIGKVAVCMRRVAFIAGHETEVVAVLFIVTF